MGCIVSNSTISNDDYNRQKEMENYIINNIDDIFKIKERYPFEFQQVIDLTVNQSLDEDFEFDKQNNAINKDNKHFYLIFPETRLMLLNSEYCSILCLTGSGLELLKQNKKFDLLYHHDPKLLYNISYTDFQLCSEKIQIELIRSWHWEKMVDVFGENSKTIAEKYHDLLS
jgi:hypothetical protein